MVLQLCGRVGRRPILKGSIIYLVEPFFFVIIYIENIANPEGFRERRPILGLDCLTIEAFLLQII
jgi:hypothetical protein